MSFHDRDYNRGLSGFTGSSSGNLGGNYTRMGRFALPKLGRHSVVTWLLIINIAAFFLDALFARMGMVVTQATPHGMMQMPLLDGLGHFSATLAIQQFQIWRLITFQFLHANFNHILMNMLGLFFLGPMIEMYLGSKRFLAFYLLCGITGAVAYLLLLSMGVLVDAPWTPLVGASAGIFGILVAAARIAPDTKVLVMFILPVPLKVVLWVALAIAAYTVINAGSNAGGQAAHLGGAALGFLLVRHPNLLNFADRFGRGSTLAGRAQNWRQQREEKTRTSLEAEVNRILDKVKISGIQSLTNSEKKTLGEATRRQQ